jgi:hypothetical protein
VEAQRQRRLAELASLKPSGSTRGRAAGLGALVLGLWLTGLARSEEPPSARGTRAYGDSREPCSDRNPLRNPYFGDLHVHTGFSLDASTQGTRTRPSEAYRFAKGERVGIQPFDSDGKPLRHVQLARPLDFAAITDHSELIGELNICSSPGMEGHNSVVCRVYRGLPRMAYFWMNTQAARAVRHGFCGTDGELCTRAARAPWDETLRAAEDHYDRSRACSFTTFPGYEWTGAAGPGNNFHRNVIFRNANVPERPISFIDTPELRSLWQRLDRECRDAGTGCEALVIPHNSNLSGGFMFAMRHSDGSPISADDARLRARYERLAEVMQHKGDSECHPAFSSGDELCGFEKLAMRNFRGRALPLFEDPPVERQFLRHVLRDGLALEQATGVNPFQFGFIASTDTHLGTPGLAAESADYPGHGGAGNPAGDALPLGLPDAYDFNPGGLAVLWAEENARDSLFDAMLRREAYGTSGPRIVVRLFGGWQLPPDLCERNDRVETGYRLGVPMGGVLETDPKSDSPRFMVSALRDPGASGTPLQRIQIIKGWLTEGEPHERVFEVAGDASNGAAVDLQSCRTSGPGFDSLCGVWRDPEFDAGDPAFYYARVVENPTCRWTQKLCTARGVRCDRPSTIGEGLEDCCRDDHRPVIQERAWTSPVWYSPASQSKSSQRGR